jgi:hypothetical protein
MENINPKVLVKMIERLLKFPYGTICKHHVAAQLLAILEQHGYPLSQEKALVKAVIDADDESALELLKITLDKLDKI